jgi:hypothetical protein
LINPPINLDQLWGAPSYGTQLAKAQIEKQRASGIFGRPALDSCGY